MNFPWSNYKQYPVDAFPKLIREAILEVQENVKAPLPLISLSFLSAMSATAQTQVKVKHPISGQYKPATLFVVVIADPGERKSTVDGHVYEPLRNFDKASEAQYREALRKFNAQHKLWKSVHQKLSNCLINAHIKAEATDTLSQRLEEHDKNEPIKPRLRRFLLQDTSDSALLDILEGESNSVSIICDEGETILRSPLFERQDLINKAWDGGTLQKNRGNGVSISARDPRITLSVMVQESVFNTFLKKRGKASRGIGFFSRILIAWPKSTKGERFNDNIEKNWECLSRFHVRVSELLPDITSDQPIQNPPQIVYELDDDAKDVFIRITNRAEQLMQPSRCLNDISDVASKLGENLLRIAALLHHFSNPAEKISRDTIERADKIIDFHLKEFKRIFSSEYAHPQWIEDSNKLIDHLRKKYWKNRQVVIKKNIILNCGPLRSAERLDIAIEHLHKIGAIHVELMQISGKKPTMVICLIGQYFQNTAPQQSATWSQQTNFYPGNSICTATPQTIDYPIPGLNLQGGGAR